MDDPKVAGTKVRYLTRAQLETCVKEAEKWKLEYQLKMDTGKLDDKEWYMVAMSQLFDGESLPYVRCTVCISEMYWIVVDLPPDFYFSLGLRDLKRR